MLENFYTPITQQLNCPFCHIVVDSKELSKSSVCAKIAHATGDGKPFQTKFCNLDAVISVSSILELTEPAFENY